VIKSKEDILSLAEELKSIGEQMIGLAESSGDILCGVNPTYKESARNLLHYLAFRRHDLRKLQAELAELGLSSLGRSESHVLASIEAVLVTLWRLADHPIELGNLEYHRIDFQSARHLLEEHTKALLGPRPKGRNVHIMVTMPSAAADDYELVFNLLTNGMDCMRINCAHDDPETWSRMIENLRRAHDQTQIPCKIIMDVPGPKLRTGSLIPGPTVIKYRPERNAFGDVTKPADVFLTARENLELILTSTPDPVIPVPAWWLEKLEVGDTIKFTDSRGSRRSMKITETTDLGFWAEARKTAYVTPGTVLSYREGQDTEEFSAEVCDFPARENFITLNPGDLLILTRDPVPGTPAKYDESGNLITPARISCAIPEVLEDVQIDEPVWFDDGKIEGVVEEKDSECLKIRITQTGARTGKLGADKGINLPMSKLRLPAITERDKPIIEFIVSNADILALSFANNPEDIRSLMQLIKDIGGGQPSIVLKIETKRGFENLPAMILEAMKTFSCGVMIARGDLAVEAGFERLAEVQEEILWLCEAAHIPVIWATQVLESLAKQGAPTRAEISDAVMGHRAECVMLNKGPHILQALTALDDILKRMETHQFKKMSMLRELKLAYNFPHR